MEWTAVWIPLTRGVPEIPKGKHGVKVLLTLVDYVLEEIEPGKGIYVTEAIWNGKEFKKNFGNGRLEEIDDTPTHWIYFPKPAIID